MTPIEEQNAFFDALGKVGHRWTGVENALGTVFCACFSPTDTHAHDGIALAAFYAVENFRSKLGMVDAAVRSLMHDNAELSVWVGVKEQRKGLFEGARKASVWRNRFAHYTVVALHQDKRGRIALVPNVYNTHLHTRLGKGQEVYTARDIIRVSATWESLDASLRRFATTVRRSRMPPEE